MTCIKASKRFRSKIFIDNDRFSTPAVAPSNMGQYTRNAGPFQVKDIKRARNECWLMTTVNVHAGPWRR